MSTSASQTTGEKIPHILATLLCFLTLCLLFVGAMVTSTSSGLSVPDWPTTFGQNMFAYPLSAMRGGVVYEHSHRLFADHTVGHIRLDLGTAPLDSQTVFDGVSVGVFARFTRWIDREIQIARRRFQHACRTGRIVFLRHAMAVGRNLPHLEKNSGMANQSRFTRSFFINGSAFHSNHHRCHYAAQLRGPCDSDFSQGFRLLDSPVLEFRHRSELCPHPHRPITHYSRMPAVRDFPIASNWKPQIRVAAFRNSSPAGQSRNFDGFERKSSVDCQPAFGHGRAFVRNPF